MIDYYAHVAVQDQLRVQAAAAGGMSQTEQARLQELFGSASSEESAALIGLFVDQVLAQAASDGTEASLLGSAGALWKRGSALYDGVGEVRKAVEEAVSAPDAPGAVDAFNGAMSRMVGLLRDAKKLESEILQLRGDLRPLKHLPPHPRQSDLPLSAWGYGDTFLARRGAAFVRTLFDRAGGDPAATALAVGALAGYAGNITGSAYVGHGVGGPRRSHRFRDRLARNAVGSWCAAQFTVPGPGALADKLRSRVPASGDPTPSPMAQLLAQALQDAYDPAQTPPLPDIDLGLRRVLRQLELYEVIRRPELPQPLTGALGAVVAATSNGGLPQSQEPLLYPQSGGGTVSGGDEVTGADTTDQTSSNGGACGWAGLIVFLLVFAIACIVGLIEEGDCGAGVSDVWDAFVGGDEPEPTQVTADGLTALAQSPVGPQIAHRLFEAQLGLWQAADQAFNYMALVGLIPPDDLLITSPLYGQFLALPPRELFPLQEDPMAEKTYGFDPSTPPEEPRDQPSPFGSGDDPSVFVVDKAPELALNLLLRIIREEPETQNLDADADRGYLHPCWTTDSGGSVHDDPVPVQVLAYDET
ncbi:hypothetical protein ACFYRK_12960 [Streptomyces sp. NPDC005381]|uniref:hypothetical protein n=1 Tax=Streptomyces sp. NPDC005381 TaxID=3364714 RepID=UPI00367A2361